MRGLIVALGLWLTIGMYNVSNAQNVSVNVNINLDRQPAWGPSGYHYAAFYYIPAINVYYDVVNELFYYRKAGRWIADYYLPAKYYRYDLYSLYKVVLNDLMHPWIHNKVHRQTYAHFKRIRTQAPIRLMSDHRYHKAKNNTRAWVAPRKSKTDGHQAVRPDKTRNDRKPIVRDSGREKGKNAVKNSQNSRRDKDLSVTRSSERTDKSKTATSENDGRSKRKEKARSSDERKSDRSDSANHN